MSRPILLLSYILIHKRVNVVREESFHFFTKLNSVVEVSFRVTCSCFMLDCMSNSEVERTSVGSFVTKKAGFCALVLVTWVTRNLNLQSLCHSFTGL